MSENELSLWKLFFKKTEFLLSDPVVTYYFIVNMLASKLLDKCRKCCQETIAVYSFNKNLLTYRPLKATVIFWPIDRNLPVRFSLCKTNVLTELYV